MNVRQRRALAEKLRTQKGALASQINEEFFLQHPDWRERYGERGVRRGLEDAAFHIDFLNGAIEVDSVAAFEDYARWTRNVLSARGIAPCFLAENLNQVGAACRTVLTEPEQVYIDPFIRAATAAVESSSAGSEVGIEGGSGEHTQSCRMYTRAILQGQRKAAANVVMEQIGKGTSLLDIYVDILEAAQFEIGRLWESNVITVAQEHMATGITHYVIAQLYPRIERPDPVKGRMVLAGVEGEQHHIGSNIVADVLEASGWDVRFLGANVPQAGILRMIEEHRASIVGISVTMLFNVSQVVTLIESLDRTFGRDTVRVVVGGGAFRHSPEAWKEIGAHGYAKDARQAVAVMNALLAQN